MSVSDAVREARLSECDPSQPVCIGCGGRPEEIGEYIILAQEEEFRSPTEAVLEEEGTYNPHNGHFACTRCYIQLGQPSGEGRERWVAP